MVLNYINVLLHLLFTLIKPCEIDTSVWTDDIVCVPYVFAIPFKRRKLYYNWLIDVSPVHVMS